jgi:hypothetical protein
VSLEDPDMTFKPSTWYPIAVALSAINLLAAGWAMSASEMPHSAVHVALALGFGYWARRLRPAGAGAVAGDVEARIELLEADLSQLRHELNETQERLNFAERVLAQVSDTRRVEP